MNCEEKNRLSDEIVKKLEGKDLLVLQSVLQKLGIGAATPYTVAMQDELLCDPIIWVEDDLEGVTLEQWHGTRAYKALHDRSVDEGQEIRQNLESICRK